MFWESLGQSRPTIQKKGLLNSTIGNLAVWLLEGIPDEKSLLKLYNSLYKYTYMFLMAFSDSLVIFLPPSFSCT